METIQNSIETRLSSTYLALPSEPDMSPLMWWKQHSSRFPTIASVTVDYYALQVTSIPCEHAFSVANHTINLTQNCLLKQMTRAFLCLKNWLKTSFFRMNKNI
ncbi:6158_t:CDS:2 [Gigaspora margarita]|uniref:6158_t:CDS:1 n=1 Tax=Gigaspora margarita TaxID=4874 RepID=A0ABN7VTL6_GIGMA|nr:6158_t:CDS:2 [Gigaspora margarita]